MRQDRPASTAGRLLLACVGLVMVAQLVFASRHVSATITRLKDVDGPNQAVLTQHEPAPFTAGSR